MKTKVGQALLKYHAAQKAYCYERMVEIAEEMEDFTAKDFTADAEGYFPYRFDEFRELQADAEKHQQAINTMIAIENMLPLVEDRAERKRIRTQQIKRLTARLATLEAREKSGQTVAVDIKRVKVKLQRVMNE